MKQHRHRWGDAVPFTNDLAGHFKTERSRTNPGCSVVKVTRHEWIAREHWHEFWKDGVRIQCDGTPPCEGVQRIGRAQEAAVL